MGVVGGAEEVDARTGDGARWTGVVTSEECSTDVKMELVCSAVRPKSVQLSIGSPEVGLTEDQRGRDVLLSASESVG